MQGTKTDKICTKVRNVKDIIEYDAEMAIWEQSSEIDRSTM